MFKAGIRFHKSKTLLLVCERDCLRFSINDNYHSVSRFFRFAWVIVVVGVVEPVPVDSTSQSLLNH